MDKIKLKPCPFCGETKIFVRRRCRGMSERQEHRQRLNARIAYAAAIERWAKNQPSRIRFFAVRRWLKEMPRKEDFYADD